jgi:hypothetical protein
MGFLLNFFGHSLSAILDRQNVFRHHIQENGEVFVLPMYNLDLLLCPFIQPAADDCPRYGKRFGCVDDNQRTQSLWIMKIIDVTHGLQERIRYLKIQISE